MEDNNLNKIIMGLDISTKCIGVTLLLNDGSEYGKVIEVTHIRPKVDKDCNGVGALLSKQAVFEEFIKSYKKYDIDEIIIEEPLMKSSKSVETVAVLMKYNGMITSSIYRIFGKVPKYISSYDARKYAFPTLLAIRKRNKAGVAYPYKKLLKDVKDSKLVLFGSMPFDVDKKSLLQGLVSDTYPEIEWVYGKNGALKTENYDASDSMIVALGYMHMVNYGELTDKNVFINNITESEGKIEYDVHYWDKVDHKVIFSEKKEQA